MPDSTVLMVDIDAASMKMREASTASKRPR